MVKSEQATVGTVRQVKRQIAPANQSQQIRILNSDGQGMAYDQFYPQKSQK